MGTIRGAGIYFNARHGTVAVYPIGPNSLKRAGASLRASARLTSIIEDAREKLILMTIAVTIPVVTMTAVTMTAVMVRHRDLPDRELLKHVLELGGGMDVIPEEVACGVCGVNRDSLIGYV